MYRQILVHPSQTRYQRILWRDDFSSTVSTYELCTVTYGTSPTSFLATRCLTWLAEHCAGDWPNGSKCVKRDCYVDDMLTGADTIHEALTIRDEAIKVLRSGGFKLGKWASSTPELLAGIKDQNDAPVAIPDNSESSILGIHWMHSSDAYSFSYNLGDNSAIISKRVILSDTSKLYYPLGLVGPVIVLAKLILQELWQVGINWDESVPQELHAQWLELKTQLNDINRLSIPRCIKHATSPDSIQVHGFCDASQRAYGACVYVRSELGENKYRTELLCLKSRVAPLKALSLPRLELSAALLLTRLIYKIQSAFDLTGIRIYFWSDSTIVLNWISSPSRRWSVFVSHRVGEIQNYTNPEDWHHVKSTNNPTDLSCGLDQQELTNSRMWWHGPSFLQLNPNLWPDSGFTLSLENIPEQRWCVTAVTASDLLIMNQLLNNHSGLIKACRKLAYCLRFFKSRRPSEPTIFVSHQEILAALQIMCKSIQRQTFFAEYKNLQEDRTPHTTSSVLGLSPFICSDGLIRVGGRLTNSDLSPDVRHPILLPRNNILTLRIIEQEHERNAHAGAQATMAAVRQRFWPISLRSATQKVIRNCVTCFRSKPVQSETIMASLSAGRVNVSRSFMHCGVDYAGPFILREFKRRNARTHKAYLAVFVCFSTKCVHFELVSDLTAEAFIAALKRFVSRREKPSCIYSDNGTTFVGAHGQLKEFFNILRDDQTQVEIANSLREHETTWKFIPPNAPHFGGLWEAAVKAAKRHLVRIVGKTSLTFEELQTIFCEIEAILNSRPLTPLSEDPNDLGYLSPGHFLIGTALNSFPHPDLANVNENRLIRWQSVEQARQHFWRRWSQKYLHILQERSKWRTNKGDQLKPNQMVLLKQPNLAPLQWLLGRVEEVHPGTDGNVRTTTIRTAKSLFTTPLTKLAILPIETQRSTSC
ncbi:PREDICTED: uncharacterized protein LOC108776159 [Cyphomyrmex costatus]|uniref:uncharacterized protein LOC108776159 n=1 Tax=Cyphomyrmex costatus TaxID=456900 RepID=UPI0008523E85|nr:PREDICTED: uncharacterized protein LOC108776159 [Cyphomyrmex costatus]